MSALDALDILHERDVRTDSIVGLSLHYHRWTGDSLTEKILNECSDKLDSDYVSRVWKVTATFFYGIFMHFYLVMKEDYTGFLPIDPLHKTVTRLNGEEGYVLQETLFTFVYSVDWHLADTVNLLPQV